MEDLDYLPATQMLESTQVLGEEGVGDADEDKDVIIGHLEINGDKHSLIRGETKIGRDPLCNISIKNPSLSRVRAIIEADSDIVTIHDNKSRNGTKKGSMQSKPPGKW